MNQSNFNGLFDPKNMDIKAMFEQNEPKIFQQLKQANPIEAGKIIEENQVSMPIELTAKIRNFIDRKRKENISEDRIKRLVKKKFHITVI